MNLNWRKSDKWSEFLEKSFVYEKMNSKLIERDQVWIQKIKKDPNNVKLIDDHLETISTTPHALADAIGNFINSIEIKDPKDLFNDVKTFTEKIIASLFKIYWKYDSELLENRIQHIVLKTIFSKGVYNKLILIFKKRHLEQDQTFLKKCKEFHKFKLSSFGVKPRFRLDKLTTPYDKVIVMLKKIEDPNTIDDKINIIADAITEISNSVTNYYKQSKEFTTEQLTLGAEDMCPIFIYCLIQAQISSLYSIFNMLGELVDDNQIRGSAGYCLATLETCMNEIMIFQFEEFEKLSNNSPLGSNSSSFKSPLPPDTPSPKSDLMSKPPLHPNTKPITINTVKRKDTPPLVPNSPKPVLKMGSSPKLNKSISENKINLEESTPPQRTAPRRPSNITREIDIDDIFNEHEDVSYLDEETSFDEWFNKK